ncbi:hypothetical protein [Pseudopedobacter sp.]|uniref:hypothetical protein n=1 Tax=Pseudopedobacter sp. TaxID=1936787 RepID=UPI003340CD63
MISYFHQNKGSFRVCEDSLTAASFDLLKYLPSELFWKILKNSLYHDKLPFVSGEMIEMKYWEKWNPEGTQNERFVEPDLFVRFYEFDLIIEAKRYDRKQQSEAQLLKEIQGYYNEFADDEKPLYFIQVGGLHNLDDPDDVIINDRKVKVCKTDWTKLLSQITSEKSKIDSIDYSQTNSYKRIFDDLVTVFAMHGFFRKLWIQDLRNPHLKKSKPLTLFSYVKSNQKKQVDQIKNSLIKKLWLQDLNNPYLKNFQSKNLFSYVK